MTDTTGQIETTPTRSATGTGAVAAFMDQHFLHFNSREALAAARAYAAHTAAGGKMLVSLAGAMSTAKIGQILSRMIRAGQVHAISCTGANLEEDLFNLLAYRDYRVIHDWRALRAEDEKALYDSSYNRVTDTCIPETVMRHLEARLFDRWQAACNSDERHFPSEYLFKIIRDGELEPHYQIDPSNSWMVAAAKHDIPVYSPGWEDSTTGNMFAAWVMKGDLPHHQCVKTGTEQMHHLMQWYIDNATPPGIGFFQIGGGIAGDFAICAVPALIQDVKQPNVPFWSYFCQITDADTSYGGYSGAVPNEKITWGKLDVETPKFMVQSDATIVAPLIFAYVLGD